MQSLDYLTLFILLIMNTATLTIIWLGIALVYREFYAARYWMAGSLLTTAGAVLLSFQMSTNLPFLVITGNFLIILGFWFMYVGLQVFYRREIRTILIQLAIIMGISLFAALAAQDNVLWRTTVYGLTYLAALICMLIFLLWQPEKMPGIYVCIGAMTLGILCQFYNLILTFQIADQQIDPSEFLTLYSYSFLLMQFSGGVLTFGFFILTIDALRKEVETLAGKDDLTGLPNRSRFNAALNSAEQQFAADNIAYAILLIDVDNFKLFNDSYGHKFGDNVLQHFCKTLTALLNSGEIMSRHGGDEFCILLPNSRHEEATAFAKLIKDRLAASPLSLNNDRLYITVSTGIAVRGSADFSSHDQMFNEADKALYRVKGNGRNGYELYHPDMDEPLNAT